MATILERPNGTYLVRVSCGRDPAGRQIIKSKVFTPSAPKLSFARLKKELDQFTKEFEEELSSQNVKSDPKKITFVEFCEKYLDVKRSSLSPTTMQYYEKVIHDMLIPLYGKMRMRELKTYHVQHFIQYLANDYNRVDGRDSETSHICATTVKRYTTVLRSIVTLAYKLEYIDEDIGQSRRLEFPKENHPEIEVYSTEEVNQILNAATEEPVHIRLIVELALFTGCRRGEIVGLKWSDIDLENHTLFVKRSIYKNRDHKAMEKDPKSRCGIRTIAIPGRLCNTLLQYKIQQDRHKSYMGDAWHNLDYIFTEENGLVMNPQTPTKQFDHFLKRHGIRHLKFHGLRHTSATMLLANGCDIKTVSTRLGHSDIETTNIYVHSLKESDQLAAKTFDTIFG